jgi:hypothetical protein
MKSNLSWGPIVGVYAVLYQMIEFILIFLLNIIYPEEEIDIVRNFNSQQYLVNPHKYGDHEFRINSLAPVNIRQKEIN